jgi:hypothetical protein
MQHTNEQTVMLPYNMFNGCIQLLCVHCCSDTLTLLSYCYLQSIAIILYVAVLHLPVANNQVFLRKKN